MMLLFKLGVIIDNKNSYKKNKKFTLIYFVLSLIFFVSYLIFRFLKEDEDESDKKQNKKLYKAYKDQLFTAND